MDQNENPNPNPEPNNPPSSPVLLQPETLPTNQPTNGPSNDPAMQNLLLESLREANRRAQQAEDALIEARKPSAPVDTRTEEEKRAEFYSNPEAVQRRLINEELNKTVAPLLEFVREFKGGNKIESYIGKFKSDPRFSPQWGPELENYVRGELGKIPGDGLNENLVGMIILTGIGMISSGMLQVSRPALVPTPTPTSVITPPHIPASPIPVAQPSNNGPRHRELTEHERRLLREYNNSHPADRHMTEAQYIAMQELPSNQVATTRIGITERK